MSITARYKGMCGACGKAIKVGDSIDKSPLNNAYIHTACLSAQKKAVPEGAKTWAQSRGQGYGYYPYKVGEVIRAYDWQIQEGAPEWLTVVAVSQRYFNEEGMSFGVGDESGYVYGCTCRAATEEEMAPVLAAIEQDRERTRLSKELRALQLDFEKQAERPAGDNRPKGATYFDTWNIYGSGDCFVVNDDEVWYLRNNGMDGDDWSRNNVTTGGAGAIGWRASRSSDLAARLLVIIEETKAIGLDPEKHVDTLST
jgi:hypothetical protein